MCHQGVDSVNGDGVGKKVGGEFGFGEEARFLVGKMVCGEPFSARLVKVRVLVVAKAVWGAIKFEAATFHVPGAREKIFWLIRRMTMRWVVELSVHCPVCESSVAEKRMRRRWK